MNILYETDRLFVRRFVPEDVEGIYELDSNPEVHTYLGNNPISTMEQAEKTIEVLLKQCDEFGVARLAIIEKDSNEFIGWCGIKSEHQLRADIGLSYYDLGYRLKQNFWGKGIATETALFSLDYGFNTLGLEKICGCADEDHAVSNHILQKIGLIQKEPFTYEGTPCNWYELTKEEFLNRSRPVL